MNALEDVCQWLNGGGEVAVSVSHSFIWSQDSAHFDVLLNPIKLLT